VHPPAFLHRIDGADGQLAGGGRVRTVPTGVPDQTDAEFVLTPV
jgi:hypothetical protein